MDNSKDYGRSVNVPGAIIMNLQMLDLTPVTSERIKHWTNEDKVLSKVKKCLLEGDWTISPEMSDEFKPYTKRKNEISLEAGVILWGVRVVVPDNGHAKLLDELHESHPGASKMKSIARAHMWWPKIDNDIEDFTHFTHCTTSSMGVPRQSMVKDTCLLCWSISGARFSLSLMHIGNGWILISTSTATIK